MSDALYSVLLLLLTKDEAGWAYYAKGSVNGSKYHVVHKAMTYSAAQEQCKKYDGYLARINTIREQVFIEDFVQQELEAEGRSFQFKHIFCACAIEDLQCLIFWIIIMAFSDYQSWHIAERQNLVIH